MPAVGRTDRKHIKLGDKEEAPCPAIVMSAEELSQLKQLLQRLTGAGEGPVVAITPAERPRGSTVTPADAVNLARRVLTTRRLRSEFLSPALTGGEPAYDMLLSLYVLDGNSDALAVNEIIRYSGIAATTAIRWLDYLADQDLIGKSPSPRDRRVVLVSITEKARGLLNAYFTAIIEAGLA